MNIKRFIPDRILKIANNWNTNLINQPSGSNFIPATNIELMPRNNNSSITRQQHDLDGVNVINIERTITNNGIIVEKEKYENIRKYIVTNLDNISAAIEFIKSSELKDEIQDTETITEIKFKFGFGVVRELNSHEIWDLSGRFSSKSISLCFCAINDDSFYIYWKSKENQSLLYLSPFNEKFEWRDRKLRDFVMMFLKSSLKNGHSGINPSLSLPKEAIKVKLHYLADIRGYNIMLLAVENGDIDVVKNLLDYGINTELPNRSINAQILAYNNRHFGILEKLLNDNQTYPPSIDITQCSDEIRKFYEISKNLHEAICAGNQKKAFNLAMQKSNCRYYYNLKNDSAMKTALDHKKFDIYDELLRYGLCLAPHEDIIKITKNFPENEKQNLRSIHANCTKVPPEYHMNIFIGNTSIYQEDHRTRDGFKPIYSSYRAINNDILLKVLLLVVAASKNFRIIFDFSRESIQTIDPNLSSKSNGFSYMTGRIFIGAIKLLKYRTYNEAYGTLAHELCHYALDLTFNNDAKPYFKNDTLSRQEFDKINEECKKRYGEEEVIDLVYDCYPEDMHHAELIVRVPQLLMLYKSKPDKMTKVQEKFPNLFKFFEVEVVPAMKKAVPGIAAKAELNIDNNEVMIRKYPKRWNFYVLLGIIVTFLIGIMGLLMLRGKLFTNHPDYKFEELSEYRKLTVMNAKVIYKGIEIKLLEFLPHDSDEYKKLTSSQIESALNSKFLNLSDPDLSYLQDHIIHNWTSLAAPLKFKILSSNITFQDTSIKIQILHDLYPTAFTYLTASEIIDILEGKNLKISKMIENISGYNPHRPLVSENTYLLYHKYLNEPNATLSFKDYFLKFKNSTFEDFSEIYEELFGKFHKITLEQYFKLNMSSVIHNEAQTHVNPFQIVENLDQTKVFILSSDQKIESLIEMKKLAYMMKKKHPTRWVSFIDMDELAENHRGSITNLSKILNLIEGTNVTEFEQKLFDECFKSGNLIVLWNDYNYDFFLKYMEDIHNYNNIQLISTPTIRSQTLREKFHVEVYRFQPLNSSNIIYDLIGRRNQLLGNKNFSRRMFRRSEILEIEARI